MTPAPKDREKYNPSDEDLESPEFNAVWKIIKNWDIGKHYYSEKNGVLTSKEGMLYSGATGTDVMMILGAVRPFIAAEREKERKRCADIVESRDRHCCEDCPCGYLQEEILNPSGEEGKPNERTDE